MAAIDLLRGLLCLVWVCYALQSDCQEECCVLSLNLSMHAKSIQTYKLFVPKAVSLLLPSWLKSNWNNTAFWNYVGIIRYINFVLIICSKVNLILLGCIQGMLSDLLYVSSLFLLIIILSIGGRWSVSIFCILSGFLCVKKNLKICLRHFNSHKNPSNSIF